MIKHHQSFKENYGWGIPADNVILQPAISFLNIIYALSELPINYLTDCLDY